MILLLFVFLPQLAAQPLLFPHGWFESKNLRPRDAIMLNMMAQSNLEYGGVTLEELDKLDAVRKQLPRPESLPRDREEDDVDLDRKPVFTAEGEKIPDEKKEEKKTPFRRVQLKSQKKRNVEDGFKKEEDVEESGNPFEEIATRSPPKDWLSMRQLRNRSRKNKRKKRRYRKNGFLTRDDIIKAKPGSAAAAVATLSTVPSSSREMEKAEFDEKLRNHAQDTWERENKAAEQVRKEMESGKQKAFEEEPVSPAMKMLAEEHAEIDRRISIASGTGARKSDKLPNNPYSSLDLSKPTILSLPLPPFETLEEEARKA